jgi:hypothetical protein
VATIKARVGDMVIEAENAEDLLAILAGLGHAPSRNGHWNHATVAPAEVRRTQSGHRYPPPKDPRTRRPRPELSRVDDRHEAAVPPRTNADIAERLLYLAVHRTVSQQQFYKLLLERPDGITDEEGRAALNLGPNHFSGILMSISRSANQLDLKLDRDVIFREITWLGGKRRYHYKLRPDMRQALIAGA